MGLVPLADSEAAAYTGCTVTQSHCAPGTGDFRGPGGQRLQLFLRLAAVGGVPRGGGRG